MTHLCVPSTTDQSLTNECQCIVYTISYEFYNTSFNRLFSCRLNRSILEWGGLDIRASPQPSQGQSILSPLLPSSHPQPFQCQLHNERDRALLGPPDLLPQVLAPLANAVAILTALSFCEEDYVITRYVAEFINTLSSLIYCSFGLFGLYQLSQRKQASFSRCIPYYGLIGVGVCSAGYHMTLKYHTQMCMSSIDHLLLLLLWTRLAYTGLLGSPAKQPTSFLCTS